MENEAPADAGTGEIPGAPELSEKELTGRVKILRRFRELLEAQRDRFRQYLEVLEKQKELIESDWAGDSGAELEAQVDIESRIVEDILSMQKAVEPLEAMYNSAFPARSRHDPQQADEAAGIPELKKALDGLRGEAASLLEYNKSILARKMDAYKGEIKKLAKNPWLKDKSVYSDAPEPSLIDIEG